MMLPGYLTLNNVLWLLIEIQYNMKYFPGGKGEEFYKGCHTWYF